VAEDRIKVVSPNESPEAGIAESEKRLGACSNVRNLDPIVAIQKRNIPLNGCCKIGVIVGVSASKRTVGNLQIDLRVLCHPSKQRRHVLNRVRTNDESSISEFRHNLSGDAERLAHTILCGLRAPNRKPLDIAARAHYG